MDTKLVGTWTFVSCIAETCTKEISYPWGHDSSGLLSYTTDGFVFVTRMSSSDFESYCGKYSITNNTVTHHIEFCSMRDFIGTQQKRSFELHNNNNELHLKIGPVEAHNTTHTVLLVWKRVS